LKKCLKNLNAINQQKLKLANKEIHNQGFVVEGEVKASVAGQRAELTSVDTGRFMNSVNTDNSRFLVSEIKSEVHYAKFLEFGTSKLSPRRHFQNSLSRKKKGIRTAIQNILKINYIK
jgi:hypothetical protein